MTEADKPIIRIFHNLARSGGTIVGKCLGSMKDVYLLSEIHPQGSDRFNPITQAHRWHGLLSQEALAEIAGRGAIPFAEAIRIIDRQARAAGGSLVLRDWAHLDFMAVPFLPRPGHRLLLADVLRSAFEPCQIALVRHPVDEWLSLRKLAILNGELSLDAYMEGYLRFSEHAVRIGYLRYEDFTQDPAGEMATLCERLRLPYDPGFLGRWSGYDKITGDTGGSSRGGRLSKIMPLKRAPMEPGLTDQFRRNPNYKRALELLGYADIDD